jgi:hypothetical protein
VLSWQNRSDRFGDRFGGQFGQRLGQGVFFGRSSGNKFPFVEEALVQVSSLFALVWEFEFELPGRNRCDRFGKKI